MDNKNGTAHRAQVGSSEPVVKMSVGRYAATRFSTLKPPMEKVPNPFKLLALLNFQQ
jgi:SHS family lactate transporter-like MFS transporter